MAKTLVIDSEDHTRVPFLRGILTRSLQQAGLSFDDAYKVASEVRDDVNDLNKIKSEELRERVQAHLHKAHGAGIALRYEKQGGSSSTLLVRQSDGQAVPFSRAQHSRGLECCGLDSDVAHELTTKMYKHLVDKDTRNVHAAHLGRLTYRCLRQDLSEEYARRYLVWADYVHSGRPLIVLIGGTAGSGKSTLATTLANRLDIVRTQSTDMLREVMRMMVPERLMPVLHRSSFNAWEALPRPQDSGSSESLLADGYRAQVDLLSVPCEAVVQRAVRERVSLILEGVHICPMLVEKLSIQDDTVVVPLTLAVLKPEQLRKRIKGRGTDVPQRRAERYLENFDAIWHLQSYILSESDRAGTAIIANGNKEKAMPEVMSTLIGAMDQGRNIDPEKVFAEPR